MHNKTPRATGRNRKAPRTLPLPANASDARAALIGENANPRRYATTSGTNKKDKIHITAHALSAITALCTTAFITGKLAKTLRIRKKVAGRRKKNFGCSCEIKTR
jgi:hypothetical protein